MASHAPKEPPPRPIGHQQIEGSLSNPLLRFDLPAEVEHLHRQPAWRERSGASSTTLVKHPDLRVVLVAMRQGEAMAPHRTVARITVHALTGRLLLRLPGQDEELLQGQILVLDRNLAHNVEALEDSSFLLTLAWPAQEDCP